MDANEYAQQVTPAIKSLGLAIRKAQWLGKGKAPRITSGTEAILIMTHSEESDRAIILAADSSEASSVGLPSESVAASPLPKLPTPVDATITDHEVSIPFGDRCYRIRGLAKVTFGKAALKAKRSSVRAHC